MSMSPGAIHRMPYGFGPSPGPRQGPDGEPFSWVDAPARRAVAVSFLSEIPALQRLLPPGFSVRGEPVVTVEVQYFTELEWLAGRGYNTLGVKVPVAYAGARDRATGQFLAVLWENLADPILTGRDELGFAKLYADIPPPRIFRGTEIHGADWLGHRFVDVEVYGLGDADPPAPAVGGPLDGGTLHYKYVPATGGGAEADVAYACCSPAGGSAQRVERFQRGDGRVTFHATEWPDMPTQAHIVTALRALPVIGWRGATVSETRGGKDLSDQRRLA